MGPVESDIVSWSRASTGEKNGSVKILQLPSDSLLLFYLTTRVEMIPEDFDSLLVVSFGHGIVLGIVVLLTLALFPGRSSQWKSEVRQLFNEESQSNSRIATKTTPDDDEPSTTSSSKQTREMSENAGLSPHQQLNYAVYVVLISVVFATLSNEYGSSWKHMFMAYFPREAFFMGFRP